MNRILPSLFSFCTGSMILCFFAYFQKISIGAPLHLKGYLVPFFFGGTSGLILGIWSLRLKTTRLALQASHDNLEVLVSERTLELKNEIEKRKIIEQGLRDSEKLLKEAQRIGHLGHWELTFATGKLEWSDEIYRLFGLQPQEFAATYDAFLERIHPDDLNNVDLVFKNSVEKHTEYQVEHRILLEDKTEKWVLEKGHTEYNSKGKPVRSIGIVQNITEVKLLRGILPICSFCKKIRDDQGYWNQIEEYVTKHSNALFSHSLCRECAEKHYPEFSEDLTD